MSIKQADIQRHCAGYEQIHGKIVVDARLAAMAMEELAREWERQADCGRDEIALAKMDAGFRPTWAIPIAKENVKGFEADARRAWTVATNFSTGRRARALANLRLWDTSPREDAWIFMVAFRACSADVACLTETGKREAKNLRARLRREEVIS